MSELEKYRALYNQFVTLIAELHNHNVKFSDVPTVRNGFDLRRTLRNLRAVEKELLAISVKTSKEFAKVNGPGRPKRKKR
jgi:molybdenum cofactor biosynthesis enzyme MoaA